MKGGSSGIATLLEREVRKEHSLYCCVVFEQLIDVD